MIAANEVVTANVLNGYASAVEAKRFNSLTSLKVVLSVRCELYCGGKAGEMNFNYFFLHNK